MENNQNSISEATNEPLHQTIHIHQQNNKSNGIGIAGFILALIGIIFSWVPVFGWIMWFLGLLLSFIGVFKRPRGLAIAGLIISLIDLIILIAVIGAAASIFG